MSSCVKHIKLRGHHLICLHFFRGEGYNPEFVDNLRTALKRIEAGEGAKVVEGPDDVCRMCPYLKESLCAYGEGAEKEIGEMDIAALKLLGMRSGDKVDWRDIREKIPGIFGEWSGKYCAVCDWMQVCKTDIAFRDLTNEATEN